MSSEELAHVGKWKIIRESVTLPDGRIKTTDRAYRCNASHILAFPAPGKILLLREYRPYYKDWIWMIPSGHVDKEGDPLEAAQRELREETGFRANRLVHYCDSNTSENIVITNHYYLAEDLVHDPLEQDADEMIEVHELSLSEAIDKVMSSSRIHTPSAFALLRYARENSL